MSERVVADVGMVRQSSSSSCASRASSAATPYISLVKTQLNFFMTRLLFMQEKSADSLGARQTNARRQNPGSSSSLSFNNGSASRFDNSNSNVHTTSNRGVDDGGLLGYFDEEPEPDVQVFNDNARILPNSRAKSMPTLPFPPAAPESPRPVEGKDGIVVKAPTHNQLAKLLPLSLSDLVLEGREEEEEEEDVIMEELMEEEEEEKEEEKEEEAVEEVDVETDSVEDSKPPASTAASRRSVPSIPPDQRVFPKNQRRSKRMSTSRERPVRRSKSFDSDSDHASKGGMSKSCH